jgi:BlaI family transcriptional regulator, penicillinase repressor
MKKPELPPLSDGQLEIMNVIWDHGETTVGHVVKELTERRPVSRNTVSTIITRLEEKGWLRRRVGGSTHFYSATYPREKVLPRIVHRLVNGAFQGSAEGLVLALLENGRLSAEEVARIKAMLDNVERKPREEHR